MDRRTNLKDHPELLEFILDAFDFYTHSDNDNIYYNYSTLGESMVVFDKRSMDVSNKKDCYDATKEFILPDFIEYVLERKCDDCMEGQAQCELGDEW